MNSELLYITRKLGYPSSFGKRSGLGDFLDQYPDGIYAETGAGAPMGWESAAVWFGGDSERAAARFERMMSERNELSRLFRTRVSGVLVLTFIYRLKSRMVTAIPIIGGHPQPIIDPTWLYFTMPEGGAVTLTKNGTPTEVTLEYSLDNGNTWNEWVETENVRSLTLTAGQTMQVRNTSETSTGFSTSSSDYYQFAFTTDTYAGGNTNSLLCKNPQNAILSNYCYRRLFFNTQKLVTTPLLPSENITAYCYQAMFQNSGITTPSELPSTELKTYCYGFMYRNCPNLQYAPNLPANIAATSCYHSMFSGDSLINEIHCEMIDISAANCINDWLNGVSSTGNFYCPAELTIPTGASGIPSGWTRHDI